MHLQYNHQQGFSLIEIAIVLVIMGLLLGGMFAPLSTQYENSRRSETTTSIDEALMSLYGYALTNGRLPCPDSSGDGQENRSGNTCTAAGGNLPWATLGVDRNDAWGNIFGYRVTTAFADSIDGTGCGTATAGISFELCSTGDISVRDSAAGNPVAANVPAVVYSSAKNQAWSTSADEVENTDNDNVFVSRLYSSMSGNEYDDLIDWVAPTILKTRMVDAGRLP